MNTANDSLTLSPTRRHDLDTVGGVMIVYMILSHIAVQSCTSQQLWWIWPLLYFFMPWFYFKAGMFFVVGKDLAATLRSSMKLLLNFLIFTVPAIILYCSYQYWSHGTSFAESLATSWEQILTLGAPYYNLPLWFLISLFFTRIIGCLAFMSRRSTLVATIAFGIAAYSLHLLGFSASVYPANIFLGVFFYGAGFLLKDKQYDKIILVVAIAVFAILNSVCYSTVDFRSNRLLGGLYPVYLTTSLAGCVIVDNIFRRRPVGILSYIGRHSMGYYVMHFLLINMVAIALETAGYPTSGVVPMIIYTAACLILLPPLDSLYGKLLGGRRRYNNNLRSATL